MTDIPLEALPKELQGEVLLGKQIKTTDELYNNFLGELFQLKYTKIPFWTYRQK